MQVTVKKGSIEIIVNADFSAISTAKDLIRTSVVEIKKLEECK